MQLLLLHSGFHWPGWPLAYSTANSPKIGMDKGYKQGPGSDQILPDLPLAPHSVSLTHVTIPLLSPQVTVWPRRCGHDVVTTT